MGSGERSALERSLVRVCTALRSAGVSYALTGGSGVYARGGPFSEHDNQLPEDIKRVLDVGCGTGGWVLDVAYEYPDIQVVGIDISTAMIKYAMARARAERSTNASFLLADATKPLPFPDGFFDLVNGRYMVGFIRRDMMAPSNSLVLRSSTANFSQPMSFQSG